MTISFLIFPIFYRLKRHKERQHPKSVEYKCKKCDFKTSNKQDMSCHKRFMHVKEKPHKCSECDQSFSRKHYVAEHLLNEHNIVYRYQWSQNSISVQNIIIVTLCHGNVTIISSFMKSLFIFILGWEIPGTFQVSMTWSTFVVRNVFFGAKLQIR